MHGWFETQTLDPCDIKTAARIDLGVYRSLRAVKVLLAALRSTLTVLAPQGEGRYRLRLGGYCSSE